jgi:glycine/D-amino acid oxidase-like deaminating enzyme
VPQYSKSYDGTRIHNYPIELYPTLEEETGQDTGWHSCGSLRIAMEKERLIEYKHVAEKDKTLGVNSRLVAPDEMKEIYPLIDTKDVLGGLFHPDDGQVDPAGVTQAMAKGAKMRGAEIYRSTPSRTPPEHPPESGSSTPKTATSPASTSSTAAVCGPQNWGPWSGSICPFWPSSTITFCLATCPS